MSVDLPAPFSPSRAWISPGSTVRSIRSLAVKLPKRLVNPSISSLIRPPLCSPTHQTRRKGQSVLPLPVPVCHHGMKLLWLHLRVDGDLAVDDVLLERRDLVLEVLRDVTLEVRTVDQVGAAVVQRPDVRLVVELSVHRVTDGVLDRNVHALRDAGVQHVAVLRSADATVGVDP